MEQRAHGFEVWQEPLVTLRVPKLIDMRGDPFERADHEAESYNVWRFERALSDPAGGRLCRAASRDLQGVPAAAGAGQLQPRSGAGDTAEQSFHELIPVRNSDGPGASEAPGPLLRLAASDHNPALPIGHSKRTAALRSARSMDSRQQITQLQEDIAQSIIGQEHVVSRLVIGLLANGNLLLEGLPGTGQDPCGQEPGQGPGNRFFPHPVHAGPAAGRCHRHRGDVHRGRRSAVPLRTRPDLRQHRSCRRDQPCPAKVQAALLEAMEERQVTVAGTTHKMPDLFMVMATQNPVEQEGTYPLPEAQMDRFLMHIYIDYPDEAAEGQIIRLVRGEEQATRQAGGPGSTESTADTVTPPEPVAQQAVFDARAEIAQVTVSEVVERYMVDLVFATRYPERYNEDLRRWIQVGASPRGALALDRCARARAWLAGRDHVLPDDVRDVAPDCLRHRLMLSYEASADGISANAVVEQLLQQVAVA